MGSNAQEVARRWFAEVWTRKNNDTCFELMGAESKGHVEGAELIGPEQFLHMRDLMMSTFPDLELHVDAVTGEGENAVVRWRFHGTHSGPGLGVSPTQLRTEARGMTWLRVIDGRIVEGWDAWNMGAMMENLRIAANNPG